MCYFFRIKSPLNQSCKFAILRYLIPLNDCYEKYFSYFQDDFSDTKGDVISYIKKTSPYFWLIFRKVDGKFMGFVSLDNFIGNDKSMYSAEITTCFDQGGWGSFARYSAKYFLKYCFDKFGFTKIVANIYPDNFRVKKFLKDCGFIYESTLKNNTIRKSKLQDIEVHSLYRSYYYKDEVNYD